MVNICVCLPAEGQENAIFHITCKQLGKSLLGIGLALYKISLQRCVKYNILAKFLPVLFRGVPGDPPPGGAPHEAEGPEDVEYGLLQ